MSVSRARNDPTERLRSVLALPEDPSAAPALLAAVEDVALDVARAALRRLVPVAGPKEVARLRERLLELDIGIVGDAAAALRALGDVPAEAVCSAALFSDSPARRHKSAIALRGLHAPGAHGALLRALEDETAPVRRTAVEALERLPADAATVVALRCRLADRDASVRATAVRALARLDAAATEPLVADEAREVREALARAACTLREETVTALLDDEVAAVRVAVLKVLVDCAGAVPPASLVARAADESRHVRRAACDTLAAAGGETAERALVGLLLDPSLDVRGRAVVALERLHGENLGGALARALEDAGAEPRLRCSLIELLGRRGYGELALGHAGDPAPEVRIAVAHAIAGDHSPEAELALGALAQDAERAVRNAARTVRERR